MSVSRTSHYTPRSSASHGRIVRQNSTLSALLLDNTEGVAPSASHESSVVPTALDVVSSADNLTSSVTNTHDDNVVVDSKSSSRLKTASNKDVSNINHSPLLDYKSESPSEVLPLESVNKSLPESNIESASSEKFVHEQVNSNVKESKEEHNIYAYRSLKHSRAGDRSRSVDSATNTRTDFNGDGVVDADAGNSDKCVHALTPSHTGEVVETFGLPSKTNDIEKRDSNLNYNSHVVLRSSPDKKETNDTPQPPVNESVAHNSGSSVHVKPSSRASSNLQGSTVRQGSFKHRLTEETVNQSLLHKNKSGLGEHQHTRLSINSQHDRVSRYREPLTVDTVAKSVPPLDFSKLSRDNNQSAREDSPPLASHPYTQGSPAIQDQNLHASGPGVVHFSSRQPTTRRTYEVSSPVVTSQLPHVTSSADNFRDHQGTGDDQETYRDRQGQPQTVASHHSDLADDLHVPYPFDTQAGAVTDRSRYDKPPSPPVQTTPPPQKEPATSLRGNSNVYAVSNPELQRAQGITPTADRNFTPRQYSGAENRGLDQKEVKFNSGYQKPESRDSYKSPLRDRAPTPYAGSPTRDQQRSPGEYVPPRSPADWDDPEDPKQQVSRQGSVTQNRSQSEARNSPKQGLPPQHPPLDHQHSRSAGKSAGSRRTDKAADSNSVKRVYVESPSFTREEEEEYRFVSSRLEDIEDKQKNTFRDMNSKNRGYGGDDVQDSYARTNGGHDVRYEQKRGDRDRGDRDRVDKGRDDRRREDRYEDRNEELNGYADRRGGEEGRYEDRDDKYGYYDNRDDRYGRLHAEREYIDREPQRGEDPPLRQFGKQNTEMDERDLRKEAEYQLDLKKRLEKQSIRDIERRGQLENVGRDSYENENFARDSLEYPDERDHGRQDYGDYNGYGQPPTDWHDPPQNPYQEPQQQYYQEAMVKQDSKPDFYDPDDAQRMEIVNPKPPKYDYVNNNKFDYGKPPPKSYRQLVHKKKEEEEKLDTIFITPKVPPKNKRQKKASHSAQPEHLGHQPPVQNDYPLGFKPSSAEELWAKKAAMLSGKKDSAGSKKTSANRGGKPKWNINPQVKPVYKYEPPPQLPPAPSSKPPNMSYGSPRASVQDQRGYGTPTRHLQPLENRPEPPVATEMVPVAVHATSPYRRHLELKPITQEITTEDGQRISVDINLRLISPPPGPGSANQQLAVIPVQETQGLDQRAIGVPYQMQDQYGYDNGYSAGYNELQNETSEDNTLPHDTSESSVEKKKVKFGEVGQYDDYQGNNSLVPMDMKYQDIESQIKAEEMALADPSGTGYSQRYQAGGDDETASDLKSLEEGYAAIYSKMKNKDPNEHPWYKVYNLSDYKKMQREIRLSRGTLGPDLDTEPYKEKLEKRHKQFEYARMVMEKNRMELQSNKPPKFPRQPQKQGEDGVKRKAAIEYSKNVPKPVVKPRPNQYNSYEVSAQITPGGKTGGGSPVGSKSNLSSRSPQSKTMDVLDIQTLQQRHLQERKTTDKIRQNMDSVLSQKAQKA